MRRVHGVVGSLAMTGAMVAAACGANGGDGSVPDAVDAGVIEPSAPAEAAAEAATVDGATMACRTAPTGDWSGEAEIRDIGAGGWQSWHAKVTWARVSTDGCVDRYRPSGVVTHAVSSHAGCGGPCVVTAPVVREDGLLVIDRSTSPATYRVQGNTHSASPFPFGWPWAASTGTFDGRVIAGGFHRDSNGLDWMRWQFARVDDPPALAPGECVEPPSDEWTSTTRFANQGAVADVRWARVATVGCVDTFTPLGTLTLSPGGYAQCPGGAAYEPATVPLAISGARLVIDRSTAPPTFDLYGATVWRPKLLCTGADGSESTLALVTAGLRWASFAAAYDGHHFGGTIANDWTGDMSDPAFTWELSRP